MLTGTPGHLKSFDYVGPYRYSLTFCTESRQRLFTTQERVDLVLMQIHRSAEEERFAILAYCFMPDHLHLLVEGRCESSDCWRFINRGKQFSGFVVARYILENPVRAGLARCVEDYPFAGSRVYSLVEILSATAEFIPPRWSG